MDKGFTREPLSAPKVNTSKSSFFKKISKPSYCWTYHYSTHLLFAETFRDSLPVYDENQGSLIKMA